MKLASIVVTGLLLFVHISAAQDVESVVSRHSGAVATIATYDGDGRLQQVGTGFIVDNGLIVASEHIVRDAAYIASTFSDAYDGEIKGVESADAATDLAVLAVSSTMRAGGLTVSDLQPEIGSEIVVIGSPMGLTNNVTKGTVSAVQTEDGVELLQISAPVSSGASGSPVLNLEGKVVGVVTSQFGSDQAHTFAVSAKHLMEMTGSQPRAAESESRKAGYSIVVASEATEASANDVARGYRGKGFEARVISSSVGGTRRYRVCLGSYDSTVAAASDRDRLAGVDVPSDAWVLQVP